MGKQQTKQQQQTTSDILKEILRQIK